MDRQAPATRSLSRAGDGHDDDAPDDSRGEASQRCGAGRSAQRRHRGRADGWTDPRARRGRPRGVAQGDRTVAMIALPTRTRVWIAAGVTDMRKGMDGLAAIV